ncbi:MAG: hypothetical protein NT162_03055, partial [Candidatus Woesebacteria bacterium]|nr:hypothetical protein [Candidatus Woesebacteria bacterium]
MLPEYGEARLLFPHGKQKAFMESVFKNSGLNAEGLAKIIQVSSRTIRDWKRAKFHVPQKAVNVFCKQFQIPFPQKVSNMIENWKRKKLKISIRGGLAYYQKYGLPGSLESRR